MGNTIHSRAAVDDIVADIKATQTSATARGGRWQALADSKIGPILALLDSIAAQRVTAGQEATTRGAELGVASGVADDLLGKVSDDVWNAIGRPKTDAYYSLFFPGGVAAYTEGDTATQPTRMQILAKVLEANLHPKLTAAQAQAFATTVSTGAVALKQAVDVDREAAAAVEILDRVHVAVTRAGALELAALKRLYKAEGFSEKDIHEVIPDRPRASAAAKVEPPKKVETVKQVEAVKQVETVKQVEAEPKVEAEQK